MRPVARNEPHSKLLTKTAKEVLLPEGMFQKGRSRTWIDDHGWWIIVIEFQPSSWSKGSHLNVGAMRLWVEKDYFSFDDGYRVAPFVEYVNDDQFAPQARKLALAAREEVLKLRKRFASVQLAARYLRRQVDQSPGKSVDNVPCGHLFRIRWGSVGGTSVL
jgi:hypothetical protein